MLDVSQLRVRPCNFSETYPTATSFFRIGLSRTPFFDRRHGLSGVYSLVLENVFRAKDPPFRLAMPDPPSSGLRQPIRTIPAQHRGAKRRRFTNEDRESMMPVGLPGCGTSLDCKWPPNGRKLLVNDPHRRPRDDGRVFLMFTTSLWLTKIRVIPT